MCKRGSADNRRSTLSRVRRGVRRPRDHAHSNPGTRRSCASATHPKHNIIGARAICSSIWDRSAQNKQIGKIQIQTSTMFYDAACPVLEDALLNDRLLFDNSPVDSLINFELPALDSDSGWQLSDIDFNSDNFVNSANGLNKEGSNFVDESSIFDFTDLNKSIIDELLLDAFNGDVFDDAPQSGTDSPICSESDCALQTHDYIALTNDRQDKKRGLEKMNVKIRSWGEPKFCAERGAFRCPVEKCGKLYAKASQVRAHLRRHSGEKPYKCTWSGCAWRFARSDELARHRRSHSGDKPYQCGECAKRFARSDHLTKHGRVHARRAAVAAAAARHASRRTARGILLL